MHLKQEILRMPYVLLQDILAVHYWEPEALYVPIRSGDRGSFACALVNNVSGIYSDIFLDYQNKSRFEYEFNKLKKTTGGYLRLMALNILG